MDYKISIHGRNFYKEIELTKDWSNGLSIGTTKECQMRFSRESFAIEFVIRILSENGQWKAECDEAVYLKKQDGTQESVCYLMPLDKLSVCDCNTHAALFSLEFSIDFVNKTNDFDRIISCQDCVEFTVGGVQGCTVRIIDPVVSGDYVKFTREDSKWIVDAQNARFGILINGFPNRDIRTQLQEKDMITINGFSFYWSKKKLYTSVETELVTSLPVSKKLWQKNHLQYPKFVRSARQQFVIPKEKVDILSPKNKPEEPKKNLVMTMVPMLVSMGMMVMMRTTMGGNAMYVLMCIGMGAVSVVMGVVNYRNEGSQYQKNIVKRENDYNRYIAEQEEKIQELRTKERIISAQKYPSLEEELSYVEDFDARLFEKQRMHEDYLFVRIGEGTVPSQCEIGYKKQEYREVDDPLMDYPEKLNEKYYYIENMPVVLDLTEVNAVGFLGDRTHLYQMTKNLILQLCIEHYYQDVKLYLLMGKEDRQYFEWARWFRNFREDNGMRNFGYDENSSKIMLEYLYAQLSEREKLKESDIRKLPTNIVLIYRSELLGEHPVSNYLENASKLGFIFLFFEEYVEKLNPYCSKRIFLHADDYTGYIQDIEDGEQIQHFRYSRVPVEKATETAMKMACVYVDEVSLEASLTKNITLYQLLGILNVYDLDLAQRWTNSRIYDTMAAPLGVKSGDEIVYLDLHEKYHGPHGLVAGTTGSGKSEILQSYILSMATLFHPYEVGFIIIDFKGGGMVNQLRNLPHLNGAITNIDGKEINRSLASIKAELRKRQRLFAEYEVNHINDYIRLYKQGVTKQPLPHLILIVDEFAELKSEQPEFMKELISAARIGRSLGVHLILATQKPSGVVNDQIWSNSKFKLCLKVQNQSDSNEVLKSPLAAEIREPGRAYLQVGNNEIFQLFQSAYSGAPVPNGAMGETKKFKISKVDLSGRREVIFEQKPTEEKGGNTQLDAIVDYVEEYCREHHIKRLPDICLPPLPEVIPYTMDGYENQSTNICVPIGMYDDPDMQYQGVARLNLCEVNTMIIGSAATGKTNLLQTIIRQLATKFSPKDANIYILDFGSMYLKNYEKLHHIGGIVTLPEEEKLKNLFKLLSEEIQIRKAKFLEMGISSFAAYKEAGYTEFPRIFLMIDNFTAFKEVYADAYEESFLYITREGVAYGISVVVTNCQTSGLGYKHTSNFAGRIVFHCNDSSEYSSLFERCRMQPKDVPGRALCKINKEVFEVQTYLAFEGEKEIERSGAVKEFVESMNVKYGYEHARMIPEIPVVLDYSYIRDNCNHKKAQYMYPVGLDYASIEVVSLDFKQVNELCIIGNEQTKRMQALAAVFEAIAQERTMEEVKVYVIDNIERPLKKVANESYVKQYTIDYSAVGEIITQIAGEMEERYALLVQEGVEALSSLPLHLVIVNSRDAIEYISATKSIFEIYTKLMKQYKSLGICFVYSDIEDAPVAYGGPELMKRFKDGKKALVTTTSLKEFKFCEIPSGVVRNMKDLKPGDVYLLNGASVQRIKLLETE